MTGICKSTLFPVKMAKMSKLRCGAAGRAQQAKRVQGGRRPARGTAGTFAGRSLRLSQNRHAKKK